MSDFFLTSEGWKARGRRIFDGNVYSSGMAKEREKRREDGLDFGVRVGVVLEREARILLVRHEKPGIEPYWVLPGGRLEPGESIPDCARREILEETNLKAEFSEVLYVSEFMREGRHTIDVTVEMTFDEGQEATLGSDPEVAPGEAPTLKELRWVEIASLANIELKPAWIQAQLTRDRTRSSGKTYLGGGRN